MKIKIEGKKYKFDAETDMIEGYADVPLKLSTLLKFNPYLKVEKI